MSTHRQRFLPLLLGISALGLTTAAAWLYFMEDYVSVPAWIGGMSAGFGVSVVFAWLMYRFLSTTVEPESIRGWTAWTTPLRIRWEDVGENGVAKVPMLPYVRVSAGTGGPAIWQPLLLADEARFVEEVARAAGEDHPLTKCLRAELTP